MTHSTLKIGVIVFSLFALGSVQAAKPESDTGSKAEHSESFWDRWFARPEKVEQRVDVAKALKSEKKSNRYFSNVERSRIEDYYRRDNDNRQSKKGKKHKKKQLPPGLQKKLARGGQLPAGWQTKVARGEVLDGDILRHSELIPDELARRLPALHDGEAIRRVGDKVVRVLEGNGTVIDVIDLADVLLR